MEGNTITIALDLAVAEDLEAPDLEGLLDQLREAIDEALGFRGRVEGIELTE